MKYLVIIYKICAESIDYWCKKFLKTKKSKRKVYCVCGFEGLIFLGYQLFPNWSILLI